MKPVYILEARRTAIGRFGGGFRSSTATELASALGGAMFPLEIRREIQQVILGQVLPAGSGLNVARQVALRLGIPQEVPAYTVNLACGSSLKAVELGVAAIAAGDSQLVLAGGVEMMSHAPHYQFDLRWGRKLGDSTVRDSIQMDGLTDPLLQIGMGETAERVAERYHIGRREQDAFAALSQKRVATHHAAWSREIVPLLDVGADEHPRPETTVESLAKLKPAFRPDGSVTAGNASGINDGAALLLLADEAGATRLHLKPRAQVVGSAVVGCDPAYMGMGPVPAIRQLCGRIGWRLEQVDAVEINEAFAAQTLGCQKELQLDPERLNQRGGAIALGHPLGASGARVLVTLLHLMEDQGYQRGIASLCVGGGMGIAVAIQRI